MPGLCTISCPVCRQRLSVSISGNAVCPACAAVFEIGVYSPPPNDFNGPASQAWAGVAISGYWIQVAGRTYPVTDIVGACLRRVGWGWRVLATVLSALLAWASGGAGEWLMAGGFFLLFIGLILHSWLKPPVYVVSWVTRDGREDHQLLEDQQAAQNLLAALRVHAGQLA